MVMQPKNYKVHNSFDVVIRDCQTNEIIETGHAENVVLNQYYTKIGTTGGTAGIRYINLGGGTGVPDITDTSLFAQWGLFTLSQLEAIVALPLSRYSYKCTLAASEGIGQTITELGVTMALWSDDSSGSYLCTHAMLKDSEGNNISMGPKTDLQIIDIYVTVFVQVEEQLSLGFKLILDNFFSKLPKQTGTYGHQFGNTLQLGGGLAITAGSSTGVVTAATKTITYPAFRVANTAGNGFGNILVSHDPLYASYCISDILGLNFSLFGASKQFPDLSIFPEYTFASQQIGVGNGSNKFFNFESAFFVPGSSVVTVNDVPQTLGVDYIECPQGARHCLNYTDFIYPGSSEKVTITNDTGLPKTYSMLKHGLNSAEGPIGANVVMDFKREVQIRLTQAYQSDYYDKRHAVQISDDGVTWTTPTPSVEFKPYWSSTNVFSSAMYDPPLKCQYMKIVKSSTTMYDVRVFGWGSIEFINPPASGKIVKASWKTHFPPKSANFLYDFANVFKTLKGA